MTCSCVIISVFLYFEDVFGRRNQGGALEGREEGKLEGVWERCNCARRSLTLSANTVVYFEIQSFRREGGSTGSAEQLRVSKRTSGRQTADLHLANPSSCFLDPA